MGLVLVWPDWSSWLLLEELLVYQLCNFAIVYNLEPGATGGIGMDVKVRP